MARRLMITVDVEAQPARASADHVDRLIWGRYPGHEPGGLSEMMDIAERHGRRLVMFVDHCERFVHGDRFMEVSRAIHERGHDVQLHAHPEFLPAGFWSERGLPAARRLADADPDQAAALVDFLCATHVEATGVAPIAFRGGGYRFGGTLLDALARRGVLVDSSYNPARSEHREALGARTQFRWSNGCVEVPISCLEGFRNLERPVELNFNLRALSQPDRMRAFLDAFYARAGEDAIAVLVAHSWSFSRLQDDGHFGPPDRAELERFEAFVAALGDIEVVTCADVLADPGVADPDVDVRRLALAGPGGPPEHARAAAPSPASAPGTTPATTAPTASAAADMASGEARGSERCPVCGVVELADFEDCNGRSRARCPHCKGLERQRVLAQVYDDYLREEFDLRGKRIMAIGLSNAERVLLRSREITDVVNCDVRPEAKPDLVADVCDMPQVEDASFDCVLASYVLSLVHDLDAALAEIHRVLRPGGRLLSFDTLRFNAETSEIRDESAIHRWYGSETLAEYRVGHFRTFGDIGLIRSLSQQGFIVKTLYGRDPATGLKVVWFSSQRVAAT